MDTFLSILQGVGLVIIGVLLFELIIFFHEGGHFICAKLSGVKVNEFALGMGPKLFSFKKGETTYSLRLLPIGGFCAMEGEDEDSDNPRAFNNVKIWKRMIIVVAGAVMNIIFGLILMAIIISPMKVFGTSEINSFSPKSYSANCGLAEGDKILKINGYDITNEMDLMYAVAKLKVQDVDGKTLQIYKEDAANAIVSYYNTLYNLDSYEGLSEKSKTDMEAQCYEYINKVNSSTTKDEADKYYKECCNIMASAFSDAQPKIPEISERETRKRFRADMLVERNGERVELKDVDFYTYTQGDDTTPKHSIDFWTVGKDKNFFTFIGETGSRTVSVVRMVGDSLVGLVSGQFGISDVSGPVGAASVTVQVAQEGLKSSFGDAVMNIVYVMMLISVNLGVVNMLPFPALDGGRFLMLIIEGIFKKPVPRKVEAVINGAGLVILLGFTLIITFKDIFQLIF